MVLASSKKMVRPSLRKKLEIEGKVIVLECSNGQRSSTVFVSY